MKGKQIKEKNNLRAQNTRLFPWMPYVFGVIFSLALVGGVFLFSAKEAAPASLLPEKPARSEQIIEPTKNFMEGIKEGKIKEAYNYTSSDFKISMPYDAFQHFIQQYDTFKQGSILSFSKPKIGSEIAGVIAYLQFGEGAPFPVSFTLIKEEKKWKIYGFVLNSENENFPIEDMEELKELIHTVNQQLAYLRNQNLISAYYKLSSKDFQENPYFTNPQGTTFLEGSLEGDRGSLRVSLYNEEDLIPIDYTLIQEEGNWKIEKMEILLPSTFQKPLEPDEKGELLEVMQIFLETLQEGLIEKAYNLFTSSAFKSSTSMPVFKTFIEDHPVLTEAASPKFLDGGKEESERIMYLLYGKQPYLSAFEVRLVRGQGGWKILGITVEELRQEDRSNPLNKNEAVDLLQALLNTLHNQQYEKYYRDYAAKGFIRSTPYEDFLHFVESHPVLKNNPKLTLLEVMQDRDQLFIESELKDNTHFYSALFVYILENGTWKVLRIEVKANEFLSPPTTYGALTLNQILVGQKIDPTGLIQDPSIALKDPQQPIYVNVFLTSPLPNAEIETYLSHKETQTTTLPISGKIDDEGNNILTFAFHPPVHGWPPGNYKAIAKTGPDQILTYPFFLNLDNPPSMDYNEHL